MNFKVQVETLLKLKILMERIGERIPEEKDLLATVGENLEALAESLLVKEQLIDCKYIKLEDAPRKTVEL